MHRQLKDLIVITIAALSITFLVWLPHLLRLNFYSLNFKNGFSTIYRNYDGAEYIVIAKTFYQPELISQIAQPLPARYYPSHFPGYSLLIALFAPLIGFLKSMLFVSVLFTILSGFAFYYLLKTFNLTSNPLWLSLVFLVLPARWVILHSVGSSEPVFIFFIISSIIFFQKFEIEKKFKWILLAGLLGSFATLTRPPGILLFISYGVYLLFTWLKEGRGVKSFLQLKSYLPLILIPFPILLIFIWYQISLGDFWAYFHSGDNIHLFFPPFQVFNKFQFWVGDIWLEDIIYILLLGLSGGIVLLKSNLKIAGFYVLTFLAASSMVAHRDISRYSISIFPFLLVAFERFINTKEFKIVLAILALAIYLYSQNFILQNTAPLPNLSIYN